MRGRQWIAVAIAVLLNALDGFDVLPARRTDGHAIDMVPAAL